MDAAEVIEKNMFEFYAGYELYSGVNPLREWSTEDLATLETAINAELQRRADGAV